MTVAAAMVMVSCNNRNDYRYEEGMAWNTAYHITYESEKDLTDSIYTILNEIDASLSPFNKESVVSKINDNRSDETDRHFRHVYEESIKIHRESDGAFDPTLAPLIRAWGFGQGHKVTTDTLRLDSLMKLVGLPRTEISGNRLVKENPDIEFNFSALAKGYGVDCVADMLARNGVENYLVEIGGEIRAAGHNPSGKKWGIGIDRPDVDAKNGETISTLYIQNGAVATSGNYRNFQETKDGRVGHTISPVTGRPVKTDIISATVVSESCMEADALATACMVMGSEEALNLCTRLRAGVMLIKSDYSVVSNAAFSSLMEAD